jgi:oligopeptide/dipeptide ABC transporter ATP-binding protein
MILDVKNLTTHFFTDDGEVCAVEDVSFSLGKGEVLGIVGESGCGKSVMSLSIMGLVQKPGKIISGSIVLQDKNGSVDLAKTSGRILRDIRGRRIGMIFQEPMTSLDPVYTIGYQIREAILAHEGVSRKEADVRVCDLLKLVGIPEPSRRMKEYPHQLSGGMRQRAMIAMALSCNPDILIADEPTTALDVTIQAQILELMGGLKEKFGMSILLITHDLGVVAEMAQRVAVMYAGRIVESGVTEEIFSSPMHPYTQGLLKSVMPLEKSSGRLPTIPGRVPSLINLPKGCAFAERCPLVKERCRKEFVPEDPCGLGRVVRCFYAGSAL